MSTPSKQEAQAILQAHLQKHGLKASRQREVVAEVFFSSDGHLGVDDLLRRARKVDPRVSQATVYRTMRLLCEANLATARHFFDKQVSYERGEVSGQHHDHIICTQCALIVEFVDSRIEQLQVQNAAAHGFTMVDHKMELYGLCARCQQPPIG